MRFLYFLIPNKYSITLIGTNSAFLFSTLSPLVRLNNFWMTEYSFKHNSIIFIKLNGWVQQMLFLQLLHLGFTFLNFISYDFVFRFKYGVLFKHFLKFTLVDTINEYWMLLYGFYFEELFKLRKHWMISI